MKRLFTLNCLLLLFSCSTDNNGVSEDEANAVYTFAPLVYTITEHSAAGTAIGSVSVIDPGMADLTYTIDTDLDILIDETTGELTVGENLILDFETENSLQFSVSVFDGAQIVDGAATLNITDVLEYEILSEEQRAFIDYYKYLTLWQSPTSALQNRTSRWEEPIKLYLDGNISGQFRAGVATVLEEYNAIFTESDFNITLVETLEESNTHLYFGNTEDIEPLWPDMFALIDGNSFSGYALTSKNNSVLRNSRIWVSTTISILFKHELGHALGFGHSDRCETENSFMCSNVDPSHIFLDEERRILAYAYANDIPAGLSEAEIEMIIANRLLLDGPSL